jgi:hypothetical protein
VEEAAKAVKAKSLITVSANERIVNPRPVLSFAKLVRAEVLELHNKCGQVLSECAADRVNSAIAEFLERK